MQELYKMLPEIDLVAESKDEKLRPFLFKAYDSLKGEIKNSLIVPKPNMLLEEFVVVCNLPIIPPDKKPKFLEVFMSIAKKLGFDLNPDNIDMPFKEDGKESYGCIFIKCNDVKSADSLATKLHNVKLGKNVIKASIMSDYDRIIKANPIAEYSFSTVDLHKWVLEPIAQQYALSISDTAHVWWHTDPERKNIDPVEIKTSSAIKAKNFSWSPKGTYLITRDEQGLVFYGGPNMSKLKEFLHKKIAGYKISRNEEYLYLYDVIEKNPNENIPEDVLRSVRVYCLQTSKELRDFTGFSQEGPNTLGWSYDGKYLAKLSKDMLSVFETPEMHMLMDNTGKRTSIKAEYINTFSWNKTNNLLAIFKESKDILSQPSMIQVLEIPSREVIYNKSSMGVEKCKFVWHPLGHFLAIVYTHKPLGTSNIRKSSIGILSIDKRKIQLAVEETSEIYKFKWEPTKDNHFAIIRYQKDTVMDQMNSVIDIYCVSNEPLKIIKIPEGTHSFPLSHIHWCPLGKFMVATRLIPEYNYLSGATYGMQYFFYVKGHQAHTINTESHDNAYGAGWDPSGRYYGSFVTSKHRNENDSFKIYNCFGETMTYEQVPKLRNWQWRKRQISLLGPDVKDKVEKTLNEYSMKYKEIDKTVKAKMEESSNLEKTAKIEKFMKKYLVPKLQKYETQRKEREAILGHPEFDKNNYECKEYAEEVLIEEQLVPLQ